MGPAARGCAASRWADEDAVGSSFIDYRGKGFWSRDAFIEEFLRALADATATLPAEDWLCDAAAHWRLQGAGHFNGWVHPCFDEHLSTEDRRASIVRLIDIVRTRPDATDYLRQTCDLAERLLNGELATDASSPLDYMVG